MDAYEDAVGRIPPDGVPGRPLLMHRAARTCSQASLRKDISGAQIDKGYVPENWRHATGGGVTKVHEQGAESLKEKWVQVEFDYCDKDKLDYAAHSSRRRVWEGGVTMGVRSKRHEENPKYFGLQESWELA
jgi:hypothetical protein